MEYKHLNKGNKTSHKTKNNCPIKWRRAYRALCCLEAKGLQGLATIGLEKPSHNGEVMFVGIYAIGGLRPSKASHRRIYHNHLMVVISWRNNVCKDLCYPRSRVVER